MNAGFIESGGLFDCSHVSMRCKPEFRNEGRLDPCPAIIAPIISRSVQPPKGIGRGENKNREKVSKK
jgi:hypothetical protein